MKNIENDCPEIEKWSWSPPEAKNVPILTAEHERLHATRSIVRVYVKPKAPGHRTAMFVTGFVTLLLVIASLLFVPLAHAQYGQEVRQLRAASEQFDERGYEGSKAISVDGSLVVTSSNGNASYSYPLSHQMIGGYAVDATLNYAGSVSFSYYHKYNLANRLTGGLYDGWQRFHVNKPAWLISVNGFAINCLTSTTAYRTDSTSRAFNPLAENFTDADFVATVDGYDVCNRMTDFSPVGGNSQGLVDVIHLLRGDGSVLTLMNKQAPSTDSAIDERQILHTGFYVEPQANSSSYGVVEYDSLYWTQTMRDMLDRHAGAMRAGLVPRRLRYFPGNGLEYLFREYPLSYGKNTLTDNINFSGGAFASPSIFYLEEIRSNTGTLVTFTRARHYPIYGNPLFQDLEDVTRGRALITEWDNHSLSFGFNSVLIEAMGRTTKVVFDTVLRGGTAGAREMMHWANTGTMTPMAEELSRLPSRDKRLSKTFAGYVTKIIDASNRVTTFDYEPYTRTYQDFNFPNANDDGPQRLTFKGYRLKEVREPDVRYRITYKPGSALPITPQTVAFGSHYQETLNNVVDSVSKYDTYGTLLTTDKYYCDFINGTGTQHIIDRVANTERYISHQYAAFPLTPLSMLMPQPRHTALVSTTEKTSDRTIVATTQYAKGSQIPGAGAGTSDYLILPSHTWTTTNGVTTGFQTFSYTLDTVRTFGGNTEMAGRYGMEVTRKITRTLRPDDTTRTLATDTVEYLHLPALDTVVTWTERRWKKLPSLQNFFHYRDIGDPRVAGKRWEDVCYSEPVAVYENTVLTDRVTAPPLYDLESAAWTSDSSGIVAGRRNVYRTEVTRGGWREVRGSLVADSLIVRGGRVVPGMTYEYHQGWGLNLLAAKRDAQGAEVRFAYVPAGVPAANVLTNDDAVATRPIAMTAFPYWYETPLVTHSIVRRWADTGLVHDTLSEVTERTYYGLVSGRRDANGWYSRAEYDRNGRLLTSWEPSDFPRASEINATYEGTCSAELYGVSMYHRQPNILHCEKDPVTGAVVSWIVPGAAATTEYNDTLVAAMPVTRVPECQCTAEQPMPRGDGRDRREDKTPGRALLRFCNWEDIPYNNHAGYDGIYGVLPHRLDEHSPIRAAERLDSLFLELMVAGVQGECVHLEVAIDGTFSQTFILGCDKDPDTPDDPQGMPLGGSALTPVAGGYQLRVNMTSAAAALRALPENAHVEVKLRVKTAGAEVRFLDGTVAEDLRPRFMVKGAFHEIEERADYTLAFEHDDVNLTTTQREKMDDIRHTENRLDANDPLGGAVRRIIGRHHFGADERLLMSEERAVEDGRERYDTESFAYTGLGSRTSMTDADGHTARTRYDDAGRPVETINTDSSRTRTSFAYGRTEDFGITDQDFLGFCTRQIDTDENGVRSITYTDALGRLRRVVDDPDSLALTLRYDYDSQNRLIRTTTPKGDEITYTYDDFGRIRTKTHPDFGTVSMAYDDEGNLRFSQSQEQAGARRLTFRQYDDLGRPTLTGEARIAWEMGIPGMRLTDVPNPNVLHDGGAGSLLTANRTVFHTPQRPVPAIPRNLLVRNCPLLADTALGETQPPPMPQIMRMAPLYADVQMPEARVTDFENAAMYPEFTRQATAYDTLPTPRGAVWGDFPAHSEWARLMPHGRVRNLRGRTAAIATRERAGEPFEFTVFSYDERGRVEAMVRFTESIGFDAVYQRYNSLNEPVRITVADPFRQHTTFYGYGHDGRMDSVWTAMGGFGQGLYQPGKGITYPQPLARPDVPDIVYSHTRTGQVASMTYPPVNIDVRHAYGVRKWIDSVIATQNGNPLFTEYVRRDSTGQILAQQWRHGLGAVWQQTYNYDRADRLAGWRMGADTVAYSYDPAGNRMAATSNKQWVTDDYIYQPGVNRIETRVRTAALGNQLTTLYEYDADGAVTQRRFLEFNGSGNGIETQAEQYGYTWRDLQNKHRRLTPVEPNGPVLLEEEWLYRYNAGGERTMKRRIYKRGREAVPAPFRFDPRVQYLLGTSGEQLAVIYGRETREDFCQDTGRRSYYYPREYLSYALDYTGKREDVSRVLTHPDGKKQYRISDHLASLRVTVDDGEVKTYDYDPWGQPIAVPTDDRARRTYNDAEKDRESGTYNLGVRQYNDDEGRFSAPDMLCEREPGISPYVYTGNNPLRYTDPSGLQRLEHINAVDILEGGNGVGGMAGRTMSSREFLQRAARNIWTEVKAIFNPAEYPGPAINATMAMPGMQARTMVMNTGSAGDGTASMSGSAQSALESRLEATVKSVGEAVNSAAQESSGKASDGKENGETATSAKGKALKNPGRAGKQKRLKELANDDKVSSKDRGWIKQEINEVKSGKKKHLRNPPGKDLAHPRGREAAKGNSYGEAYLQDKDLHKLQHKHDKFGKKNKPK